MTKYKLVEEHDPILKQKCLPHELTEETKQLAYDMIVAMQEHDGIGLAAPQVGIAERLFVIGHKSTGFVCCINPVLYQVPEAEEEFFTEGCLSFPHLTLKVKRKNKIRCEFTNLNGERKISEFSGVWAQAIQHEYDHLNGVTFDTLVGKTKLSLAKAKRQERIKRENRKKKREAV